MATPVPEIDFIFADAPINEVLDVEVERVSAEEAWLLFFKEPFRLENVLGHIDLLADSINHFHVDNNTPVLEAIAKTAQGPRMEFATRLFAKAVQDSGNRSSFKHGSLAKMALAYGNEKGALDSARQDPQLASTQRDAQGVTLFLEAMLQGNIEFMDAITRRHKGPSLVDPFLSDSKGNTALINYIRLADKVRVDVLDAFAHCLVQSKALQNDESINCRNLYGESNHFGKTAAHLLVSRLEGRTRAQASVDEVLDAFRWLAQRIDINLPDNKDRTALMDVCRLGNVEVAKELETLGGDIAWISGNGKTALSTAAWYDKPEIIHLLFRLDTDKVIASINAMTEDRIGHPLSIPLLTSQLGNWDALYAYLDHCQLGIDTCSPLHDNTTALMHAVRSSEEKAVHRLIEAGCNVNAVDIDGMSAMHFAARNFNNTDGVSSRIFYALLNAGASLDMTDATGKTPLDIILHNGRFTSSSDFHYRVNISQAANWCFNGDQIMAKEYIDSSQYGVMTCNSIIDKAHPIVMNAPTWLTAHTKNRSEIVAKDVKQGIATFNMMCWGSATLIYALNLAIEKNEHEKLNQLISMIPTEWQFPVITATAITAVLVQATNGCTDFSQVKKIGMSAKHMTSKIDRYFLQPLREAYRNAKDENKGLIGRALNVCSAFKAYYAKVQCACASFIRVMKSDNTQPKSSDQMIEKLDDQLIRDIASMSRHEFNKLHSVAKSQSRHELSI